VKELPRRREARIVKEEIPKAKVAKKIPEEKVAPKSPAVLAKVEEQPVMIEAKIIEK
jgi:hypothetical protein